MRKIKVAVIIFNLMMVYEMAGIWVFIDSIAHKKIQTERCAGSLVIVRKQTKITWLTGGHVGIPIELDI